LLLFAAGSAGETEIIDAASEPHVTDLVHLLQKMGAAIDGVGSNRLVIKGGDLRGAEFKPRPDFVDIAGYMVAAAITRGEIILKGANIPDIVDGLIDWFTLFGVGIKRQGDDLVVNGEKDLKIDLDNSGFPLAAPNLPKLAPRPWPGFPVDVIPVMAVLASRTKGRLLLQNWMYESGLEFVRELNNLGADIFISDPQRIIIRGAVKFKGGSVSPPQVIQAIKAVFLAGLCDPVVTRIHGVDILKRRYPDIFSTYRQLGAEIRLLD
jgi:UDP-N-acetylglucosamine 1-carboxyvinyltransferase